MEQQSVVKPALMFAASLGLTAKGIVTMIESASTVVGFCTACLGLVAAGYAVIWWHRRLQRQADKFQSLSETKPKRKKPMKPTKIKILLLLALALPLLPGCITSPETGKTIPDIPRIARGVKEAARIGSREAIFNRPQLAEKFDLVIAQLIKLEEREIVTVETLLDIGSQLPIKELKSREAQLSFDAARVSVALAGWSSVEIVQAAQIHPVITALREGLQQGREQALAALAQAEAPSVSPALP